MFDVIAGRVEFSHYLMRIVALLASLCVHEYWHARAAWKLGDDTARLAGRLTLNPRAHLDPLGTLMILSGAPVGWAKPVPVNANRFRRNISWRSGLALVSAAGPLSNLVLALIGSFFAHLIPFLAQALLGGAQGSPFLLALLENAQLLALLFFMTNVYLALFNLLPVPPLDGSKIWAVALPARWQQWMLRYEQYIGMAFLLIFLLRPVWITAALNFVARPLINLINLPFGLIFG